MAAPRAISRIEDLAPYAPGLSIDEIRGKFGLERVIKLASNENPLGAPPLAQEAMERAAKLAFRYPQGGNPRLARALAQKHQVDPSQIAIGNGSDEIIDLLFRVFTEGGRHNVVCFQPCFSLYPIQARINGNETRRAPLNEDLSQNLGALADLADRDTRLAFITTPDNPSGYCPPLADAAALAEALSKRAPEALLVVDEAYIDFASDEKKFSLLANGILPPNVVFLRTFSKSYGLAGVRLGYAVMPPGLADGFWRARLPFSVNIMAEAAGLAALEDEAFRQATLQIVAQGRARLEDGLKSLGCRVWPSEANFLLFQPPANGPSAGQCHLALLRKGVIVRPLASYSMPERLRVSVGLKHENEIFLAALAEALAGEASR